MKEIKLLNLFGILKEPEGWHFAEKWMLLQKTNGRVYTYVQKRLFDGFVVQMYQRGHTGICELEYRCQDLNEAIEKGESWLQKFQEGKVEAIRSDLYSPHNPEGVWR